MCIDIALLILRSGSTNKIGRQRLPIVFIVEHERTRTPALFRKDGVEQPGLGEHNGGEVSKEELQEKQWLSTATADSIFEYFLSMCILIKIEISLGS